jgi:multidrug resistance efflux pump
MSARVTAIGGFLLLLGVIVTVVMSRRGEPPRVPLAPPAGPRSLPITPSTEAPTPAPEASPAGRTETVIGTLRGEEASIAAKIAAKVLSTAGPVGTRVAKGQVVVTLDDHDLQQQAAQARETAASAAANLDKARDGRKLKAGEVEVKIREAEEGVRLASIELEKARIGARSATEQGRAEVAQAQSGLDAARAALAAARRGARPEERRKAEIAMEATRKGLQAAEKYLNTMKFLANNGGVPKARADKAQNDYDTALAQFQQAEATLAQVLAGATIEELQQAEAAVHRAAANLDLAKGGARARNETSQSNVQAALVQVEKAQRGVEQARGAREQLALADADIRAAQAQLTSANIQSQQATELIRSTRLATPIGGVISSVSINAGEIASPGRPLLTVAGTSRLYVDAAVPVRLLGVFKAGRTVTVELDSLQGRKLAGIIREVSGAANPDGRSFPARIELTNPPAEGLRPGARARVRIEVRQTGKSGRTGAPR